MSWTPAGVKPDLQTDQVYQGFYELNPSPYSVDVGHDASISGILWVEPQHKPRFCPVHHKYIRDFMSWTPAYRIWGSPRTQVYQGFYELNPSQVYQGIWEPNPSNPSDPSNHPKPGPSISGFKKQKTLQIIKPQPKRPIPTWTSKHINKKTLLCSPLY